MIVELKPNQLTLLDINTLTNNISKQYFIQPDGSLKETLKKYIIFYERKSSSSERK